MLKSHGGKMGITHVTKMALWQLKHLGTWCMCCIVSFFIVYKNLLAKFSYVYAGVILETDGSIQQSSNINNCCFIAIQTL